MSNKYIPLSYAIPDPQPTGFRESVKGSFKRESIYYGIPGNEENFPQLYPPLPALFENNSEQNKKSVKQQPKYQPHLEEKIIAKSNIAIENIDASPHNEYIIHEVQSIDTLDGISIMYGVSKELIRMENQFLGEEIYMFKKLRIPKPKAPKKERTDKFDLVAIAKRE